MSDISSQPFGDRANRTNSSPATSGRGRLSPQTIIAVSLIVALLLIVLLHWPAWEFVDTRLFGGVNATDVKDRIELVKTKSAIVTGVFGICGAVVAAFLLYWRSHSLARQAGANQRQAEIADQVHLTSLFSAAVAQLDVSEEVTRETQFSPLGHAEQIVEKSVTKTPSRSTRLGAIHTLERVIRASQYDPTNVHGKQDAAAVFAMLGGYLGARSREVRPARPGEDTIPDDLAAVLRVLHSRHEGKPLVEVPSLRLDGFTISGFTFKNLLLIGASFLRCTFVECVFENCNLVSARFDGASGVPSDIEGMPRTSIVFRNCRLTEAKFRYADLPDARFENVSMKNSRFFKAKFPRATFSGKTPLLDVKFDGADLTGTKFETGCTIERSSFFCADLSAVEFGGVDFAAVDSDAFDYSNLMGTKLQQTIGLKKDQLGFTYGDDNTEVPPELHSERPSHWLGVDATADQRQGQRSAFHKFRDDLKEEDAAG